MSEPTDDILTRPLGTAPAEPPGTRAERLRARLRSPLAVLGAFAGLLGTASALVLLLGDPQGGEPRVTVAITLREAARDPVARAAPQKAAPDVAEAPPPASRSAQEVENASGVTVVRPTGTAAPSEAVVIRVPSPAPGSLAPAPDPRLVERGRHGSVPRLGEGRLRALDVYARAPEPGAGPRIALLVTGLGIGQAATASAIAKLPPAVSLAFAPYGGDVERAAAKARAAGHEILLQAPMEPYDYPDSDPGPQTLLTSLKGPENADRLAWVMSRFSGYVALVNFMGAKLMDDPAFEPVLREIGARGLGFVDDGTSGRPVAAGLAARAKTPFARADIVADAVARPEAIDRELGRAESQARAKGFVLVSASALPSTIERIARWSRDLDARGLRLVPVSAALTAQPPAAQLSRAE